MADNRTWEFGASPEGPGERAYALGNLFKKERALKSIEQRDRMGEMEAQHGYRLAEMMAGKKYDEEAKEREAQAGVGALRRMITGNKDLAKGLGYGPGPDTISREGAMAEPEARNIPATIIPGAAPTPTDQELRGLVRQGVVQAAAQHAFPKQQNMMTLGPGQGVYDPNKRETLVEPKPHAGRHETYGEAMGAFLKERAVNEAGGIKLRGEIIPAPASEGGGYRTQWKSDEPIGPVDPLRAGYERRIAAKMPPEQAEAWYINTQAEMAGKKAGATSWQTAKPEEILQSKQNVQRATNLDMMMAYPDAKINAFLGIRGEAAKAEQILANLPGGGWLMEKYRKDPKAFLQEAAEFQQLAAFDTKYVLSRVDGAGGTMTEAEKKLIIRGFAGSASNPIEFRARAQAHQAILRAENDLASYRLSTPDQAAFNATSEMFFKSRLEKYAPGLLTRGVEALIPSGNRFRNKANQ